MSQINGELPLEIERKFLIKRPDETVLGAVPGAYKYEIEQMYLPETPEGEHPRIRRRVGDSGVECFYTVKRKISALTRVEIEREITPDEYDALAAEAGASAAVIKKTRWCIPSGDHVAEVDIYPFWLRTAVAEVELESEDAPYELPAVLEVVREITGESRFLNRDMALELQRNGYVKEEI